MNRENKEKLYSLVEKLAEEFNFKVNSLSMLTNKDPAILKIILRRIDQKDITIEDCSNFTGPVESLIESSKLINYRYVLEIGSQGVSDELTSNRDFKIFKGFPVRVELNQNSSKIKNLNGLLYEKSNDYLAINIKGKIQRIPFNEVLKVSLATIKD